MVPTVAASVDLVVHLGIDEHGVRRVNEIVAVPGRVENDVIETEPIFVRHGTELLRTGGLPPRLERFERVGIDVHRILSGQLGADGCARRAGGGRRAAAGLVGVLRPPQPGPPGSGRSAGSGRAGLGEVSITGFLVLCPWSAP